MGHLPNGHLVGLDILHPKCHLFQQMDKRGPQVTLSGMGGCLSESRAGAWPCSQPLVSLSQGLRFSGFPETGYPLLGAALSTRCPKVSHRRVCPMYPKLTLAESVS